MFVIPSHFNGGFPAFNGVYPAHRDRSMKTHYAPRRPEWRQKSLRVLTKNASGGADGLRCDLASREIPYGVDPPPGSRIDTTGDRPGDGATETNPARSNAPRPGQVENRDRPSSAQSSNANSKSADRSQPAKSQQTAPTWRDFPESRKAGSHHDQGIGPHNGWRFDLALTCRRD
jgi:hypothetical protein